MGTISMMVAMMRARAAMVRGAVAEAVIRLFSYLFPPSAGQPARGDGAAGHFAVIGSRSVETCEPGGEVSLEAYVLAVGGFAGTISIAVDPLPAWVAAVEMPREVSIKPGGLVTVPIKLRVAGEEGGTLAFRFTCGGTVRGFGLAVSVRAERQHRPGMGWGRWYTARSAEELRALNGSTIGGPWTPGVSVRVWVPDDESCGERDPKAGSVTAAAVN